MPATYTYNDAIEDAKKAVTDAWEATGNPFHMHLVLDVMGRLEGMKRHSRRKRSGAPQSPDPEQTPDDHETQT